MVNSPSWFTQLKWSAPTHVAALNDDRKRIPDFTGCYVFTVGLVPIVPGRVLYVGEAAGQSLRSRLSAYLVDFRAPRSVPARSGSAAERRSHKGKGFILEARQLHGDHGIFVSWIEYGANAENIHILEASLICYLNPGANDRIEEYRHPLLGDRERLDRRLLA
jgi:hypothetical protein